MMTQFKSSFIAVTAGALVFMSCNPDKPVDPTIPNQEEVITTLNLTLTPDTGAIVVFSFQDLDGDGGNAPIQSSDTLQSNTAYSAVLELLNETETPAEDITAEIDAEGVDHQFFFQSTVGGLSVEYTDMDANGKPIGLATTITTVDSGLGTLGIVLRHEPNKDANGVMSGDITNAGGETDIEVTFDVIVD
tara:strand:- start:2824 stop:3393 length:570 start_codon:yes stop_codon:yes gene_type:complete